MLRSFPWRSFLLGWNWRKINISQVMTAKCSFFLRVFLKLLPMRPGVFFFFHLTYSRWTSSLPSCLWSQRIFPSPPGSRLIIFLSRCKFSTLTTRQPMVEFYLLTFPRFPLRKKKHKSYFGKNRTRDFRTSRCAAYLLDHSGDEQQYAINSVILNIVQCRYYQHAHFIAIVGVGKKGAY